MIAAQDVVTQEILLVGLVFCRLGAALMVLPAFGEPYVVSRARLGIALALAVLIGMPLGSRITIPALSGAELAMIVIAEVFSGLIIGAIVRLVMFAVHFAGALIAMQSGLAAAAFFDPQEATQGTVTGNFLAIVTLVIIVVADAHLLILQALTASFELFVIAGTVDVAALVEVLVRLGGQSIDIGLRMAAPIVLFSLLFYLLLGVLNRLMPSFQVLFVAMPLQITLSFAVVMLSIGVIIELAAGLLQTGIAWLEPL
jgi:flagellar biosynthetic protein FliR